MKDITILNQESLQHFQNNVFSYNYRITHPLTKYIFELYTIEDLIESTKE